MSTLSDDPRIPHQQSAWPLAAPRRWLNRLDLSSLPVILGLIAIGVIFQSANDKFLTPLNLTNLMLQQAAIGTISVGIVLVLLLGEVDLSVGSVSGLAGAVMAALNVKGNVPGPIALLAALGVGAAIGLLHGVWIAKLRVPSFVVTLAGLLSWQGLQLYVLGSTGTINLRDKFILGLAGTFFPARDGWVVGGVFVLLYAVGALWDRRRRGGAGLMVVSRRTVILRIVVAATGTLGSIALLNANRGLPSALLFLVALIILFDLVTRRTVFGRHLLAIGGNAEAARRAGVDVAAVRIWVFGLASTIAAFGGILAGSRLLAVNQSSGGSDTLLNSIAAAVIGGTSLFGGRGSVWSALLGALVIGSISNGMDLLAQASPIKLMITGAVLLAVVTIDALARRRREAAEHL
jgi:D-xylose transport system permease protein